MNISFQLQNVGVNILSFTLNGTNDGVTFTNIDQPGGATNNTLTSGQSTAFVVNQTYNRLVLVGYASGGSILDFSVSQLVARPSGGAINILGY